MPVNRANKAAASIKSQAGDSTKQHDSGGRSPGMRKNASPSKARKAGSSPGRSRGSSDQGGHRSSSNSRPRKQSLPQTNGNGPHHLTISPPPGAASSLQENWNMALLVLLYMMQGVPLGLTTGAMPFMLQSKLSYSQVGVFSLAAYPYSLKLLWSPIVDSCFSARFGRRKSWIVPVQLITAAMLICCSGHINKLYEAADVTSLTSLFFVFVFMAATQDIAVDGWALTLLSSANVGYASTCQTVGGTIGYFTSFTVFLALSSGAFCDTYLRSWAPAWMVGAPGMQEPLVSLPGYLRFWGWVFALVTLGIAFLQPETNFTDEEQHQRERQRQARVVTSQEQPDKPAAANGSVRRRRPATQPTAGAKAAAAPSIDVAIDPINTSTTGALQEVAAAYRQLWGVVRLPAVWGLTAFLLTYRLGVLTVESAYSLKLIDKGVSKEALAFLVLFQFPVELGSAVLAGRWSTNYSSYGPFITGYMLRLVVTAVLLILTATFPANATSLSEHSGPFGVLAAACLVQSFSSTLTFTALGSFFNSISDPSMGGAYLTLLNTIANMGYILPKTPLFYVMDALTISQCTASDGVTPLPELTCPKKATEMRLSNPCTLQGGSCALVSDGFYIISWSALALGLALGLAYLRLLPVLIGLPLTKWRVVETRGC